jgi:hypothetical protein
MALYAGDSGMEAYVAIIKRHTLYQSAPMLFPPFCLISVQFHGCFLRLMFISLVTRSLAACKPPLLASDGLLLLQVPGGERGHIRVAAVAKQAGWEVLEVLVDERGVARAINCQLCT